MYLWHITVNGMGNQFYAAAAQAGSANWEALLFGSLDPRNFITVDKPPLSQWVMGLSGQLFGFSSASMLIPEALMAVATVALTYGAVTRLAGSRTGLLAGVAVALTPVAALMFRFNNPDAVMVLLMTASAYCTVRAMQRASGKWLALAGVALGFAFLAKMLEGLMVMPAIGLAYLIVAPTTVRRRLLRLGGALAAFGVSAGWFVVLTLLWPAASRPYIAGSTDNNFMNLVLGYNGFARILGRNHQGGAGDFGGFGTQRQGLSRLFSGEFGFEISWLLPAALLAVVLVVVSRRHAPRTDLIRGGVILFGGWMLIDGLVLSFMHGMVHPYYCLSLAPAVGGMFALGVSEMWRLRSTWFGRFGLAALVLAAGGWSWWLLRQDAALPAALRWTVLVLTVATTLALLAVAHARVARLVVAAGVVVALAGSAACVMTTISRPHTGGGPTVGPVNARSDRFGRTDDNPQLDAMLSATHTDWSAAITRSSAAAGLELTTHTAVMAIGGFSGTDPVPTLSQFQQYVASHRVTYYIAPDTNHDRGVRAGRQHSDIGDWVTANFTAMKVGSDTVYDLTAPGKH